MIPKVLKDVKEEIAWRIPSIFNLSLGSGTVPRDWKLETVTLPFKKECKESTNNYPHR